MTFVMTLKSSVTYIDTSCGSDERTLHAADRLAYRTAHVPQTMCHALFTRAAFMYMLERNCPDAMPYPLEARHVRLRGSLCASTHYCHHDWISRFCPYNTVPKVVVSQAGSHGNPATLRAISSRIHLAGASRPQAALIAARSSSREHTSDGSHLTL